MIAYLDDGPTAHTDYRDFGGTLVQLRRSGNSDPRLVLRLLRIIRELRPDVVNTWIVQMDVLGGLAAILSGTPWVLREPSSNWDWLPRLKRALRTRIGVHARAVIANSRGGAEYWRSKHPAINVHIIPNALPLSAIASAQPVSRGALPGASERPLVVYVGRFSFEKNVENLASALSALAQSGEICAALLGDGPLHERVSAQIAANGLAHLILCPGHVANAWEWLRAANVVVNVSVFEGQPNVVLEAIAAQAPLVVSDIQAHRDLLQDDQACFVDPSDPLSIVAGVRRVLADPADARSMTLRASAVIKNYSVSGAAKQFCAVYNSVIRGDSGATSDR